MVSINPDNLGSFVKGVSKTSALFSLVKTMFFLGILSIALIIGWIFGIPFYIAIPFLAFFVLMGFLSVKSYLKVNKYSSNEEIDKKSSFVNKTFVYPNEIIKGYYAGIMKAGFGIRSVSTLGAGKIRNPENAIILTDKQVLIVYVPVDGGNKQIMDVDAGMWQWMLSKKGIEDKLRSILSTVPLSDFVQSSSYNFGIRYEDILKVEFGKLNRNIKFVTKSENYSYSVRDKDDFESMKQIFANFVK